MGLLKVSFPTRFRFCPSNELTLLVVYRWGNWHYPMAYGLVLTSIGAGLFSTMTDTTSVGKWVSRDGF